MQQQNLFYMPVLKVLILMLLIKSLLVVYMFKCVYHFNYAIFQETNALNEVFFLKSLFSAHGR